MYNIGQTTVVGSIEEARDQNFQVISEYRAQCGDEDTRTLEGQIVIDPVHAGDKMPGTEKASIPDKEWRIHKRPRGKL